MLNITDQTDDINLFEKEILYSSAAACSLPQMSKKDLGGPAARPTCNEHHFFKEAKILSVLKCSYSYE